jgi:TonB family protein
MVALVRRSPVLTFGREVDAMHRVLGRPVTERPVTIRESAATFEPAVVGCVRPALLWPAGLSATLTDVQIEAVVIHELSHVRRADNVTALAHMVVETVFWFHPAVWWLGTRLVEEREHACDQAVLGHGMNPAVYAEGLLHVCRFCLKAPTAVAAGVASSNLSQRVEAIMTFRSEHRLGAGRRLLIAASAGFLLAGPVAAGAIDARPAMEHGVGLGSASSAFQANDVPVSAPAAVEVPVPAAVPTVVDARPPVDAAGSAAAPTVPVNVDVTPPAPAVQAPPRDPVPPPSPTEDEDADFRRGALPMAGARRPGLTLPVALRRLKPVYTPEARREKVEGTVEVEVVIGTDGTVARARVIKGLDPDLGLADEALRAARGWLFKPAQLNGEPIEVFSRLRLVFRLD